MEPRLHDHEIAPASDALGHLDCRLACFRPRVGKEKAIETWRKQRDQSLNELELRQG